MNELQQETRLVQVIGSLDEYLRCALRQAYRGSRTDLISGKNRPAEMNVAVSVRSLDRDNRGLDCCTELTVPVLYGAALAFPDHAACLFGPSTFSHELLAFTSSDLNFMPDHDLSWEPKTQHRLSDFALLALTNATVSYIGFANVASSPELRIASTDSI